MNATPIYEYTRALRLIWFLLTSSLHRGYCTSQVTTIDSLLHGGALARCLEQNLSLGDLVRASLTVKEI